MAGAMAPAGHTFAAGAESLDAPGAEAAAAGEPAKDAEAEDPGLSAITLPREAVRRIARSAAPPGARISSEAVAGLQRVAQAFVLYATDRALAEAQAEADRARKMGRGRTLAAAKKTTIGVQHVMKFLQAQLPPTAAKVASLYPDLLPADFRPPGVRLLEQLREQQQKEAALGAPPPAEASDPAQDPAAAAGPAAAPAPDPPALQQLLFGQQKRPAASGPCAADPHPAKKPRAVAAAGPAAPPATSAPAPRPLSSFFGPPRPGAAPAATGGTPGVGAPAGATSAARGGEEAPQESLEVALAAMMDGDGLLTQPAEGVAGAE